MSKKRLQEERFVFYVNGQKRTGCDHPERAQAEIKKLIADPNSWTGLHGARSKDTYVGNKKAQDHAFARYTSKRFGEMARDGLADPSNPADVAGMLATMHLKGRYGANRFRKGFDNSDGNGTYTLKYYALVGGGFKSKCR